MDEKDVEMEGGLVDLDSGDESEVSVYEIGYHLIPTLLENELSGAVSLVMDALKVEGATIIGERMPTSIELAYPVMKRINTVRKNFNEAYFGWVAFEIPKKALTKIKTTLDSHPAVLRYLITTTDKDAVAVAMGGGSMAAQTITPTGDIGKPKRAIEEGGEVSEVALNEALQTIATEDAAVEKS